MAETDIAHPIYLQDTETGRMTDLVMAYTYPASAESVGTILAANNDGSDDGRSGWMWLRLSNGDLMLGLWPRGETYFAVEMDAAIPNRLLPHRDITLRVTTDITVEAQDATIAKELIENGLETGAYNTTFEHNSVVGSEVIA